MSRFIHFLDLKIGENYFGELSQILNPQLTEVKKWRAKSHNFLKRQLFYKQKWSPRQVIKKNYFALGDTLDEPEKVINSVHFIQKLSFKIKN